MIKRTLSQDVYSVVGQGCVIDIRDNYKRMIKDETISVKSYKAERRRLAYYVPSPLDEPGDVPLFPYSSVNVTGLFQSWVAEELMSILPITRDTEWILGRVCDYLRDSVCALVALMTVIDSCTILGPRRKKITVMKHGNIIGRFRISPKRRLFGPLPQSRILIRNWSTYDSSYRYRCFLGFTPGGVIPDNAALAATSSRPDNLVSRLGISGFDRTVNAIDFYSLNLSHRYLSNCALNDVYKPFYPHYSGRGAILQSFLILMNYTDLPYDIWVIISEMLDYESLKMLRVPALVDLYVDKKGMNAYDCGYICQGFIGNCPSKYVIDREENVNGFVATNARGKIYPSKYFTPIFAKSTRVEEYRDKQIVYADNSDYAEYEPNATIRKRPLSPVVYNKVFRHL
jgi:hypothetical protein